MGQFVCDNRGIPIWFSGPHIGKERCYEDHCPCVRFADDEFSEWSNTEPTLDRRLNRDGFYGQSWNPEQGTKVTSSSLRMRQRVDVWYDGAWWPARIVSISKETSLVNIRIEGEIVSKDTIIRDILPKHICRHREGVKHFS